jgi:putative ABC transport system substrate-binding protein
MPTAISVHDDTADVESAISGFAQEPNGGLILPPDSITRKHRGLIVALAANRRLPAIYNRREFVEAGGLMNYAAMPISYRRVAAYVDRILRGTKPSELPVELPTDFQLVINLKAAKALGLNVPQTLLVLATEVIE